MSDAKTTTKAPKEAAAKNPVAKKAEPKVKKTPPAVSPLEKEEAKVRAELSQARRDHALQKLESPAKLRTLRRQLARVMTAQANKESA